MSVLDLEPQHLAAQRHGNDIRLRRAQQRTRVAALDPQPGREVLADLLDEHPYYLDSVTIEALLRWPKRTGACHVERVLVRLEIWPLRRVDQLTDRQRRGVIAWLRHGELPACRPVLSAVSAAAAAPRPTSAAQHADALAVARDLDSTLSSPRSLAGLQQALADARQRATQLVEMLS